MFYIRSDEAQAPSLSFYALAAQT